MYMGCISATPPPWAVEFTVHGGATLEAARRLCGQALDFAHGRRQLRVAGVGRERALLFNEGQAYHGVLP
jgi:hypothetical protein